MTDSKGLFKPPSFPKIEKQENLIARPRELSELLRVKHFIKLVDVVAHYFENEDTDSEENLEEFFAEVSTKSEILPNDEDEVILDQVPSPVFRQTNRNVQSRLDHEVHPMHNDLILKNIFEFCSVHTLRCYRLVCTKWLSLSQNSWHEKAVLGTEELIDAGIVEDVIRDGSEFRKNPYKSYHILEYGEPQPSFDLKKSILDTFSSSIQYLAISCDDFKLLMTLILTKLPELRHARLQFFYDSFLRQCRSIIRNRESCPFQNITEPSKLTKLELNFGIIKLKAEKVEGWVPWHKLFNRVPALRYLQVMYDQQTGYSGSKRTHLKCLTEILGGFQYSREEENFTTLNLEKLDIMVHANHSSISIPFPMKISKLICDSNLPLERLHFDLGINCHEWSIANMLAKHGKILKYLRAVSSPNRIYLKKKLNLDLATGIRVQLKNLKELELINGCVWAFHFLHFLTVPELEILRIEEMGLRQHRRFEKLNWKSVDTNCREEHVKKFLEPLHFVNLKRFEYSGPRHFSPAELRLLAKAMPNVTNMSVPLSAITFPVVCELWPGLKSLRVDQVYDGPYPLIDDYAITGLPPEFRDSNESNSERKKNITDLKELWSFVVDGNFDQRYSRKPIITDITVVHGFLQLPKLNILEIYAFCGFSAECWTSLENHVRELFVAQPAAIEYKEIESDQSSRFSSDDESESKSEYSDAGDEGSEDSN